MSIALPGAGQAVNKSSSAVRAVIPAPTYASAEDAATTTSSSGTGLIDEARCDDRHTLDELTVVGCAFLKMKSGACPENRHAQAHGRFYDNAAHLERRIDGAGS